ncbi:MAG: NUDIX hydrolase [Ignavibacteriota bacterium]|jgi:ADP-ribose pyrophosphatase|nr:MAG: NUDIX hydrolase [Chlorobiota bacterium]MBE7475519.1 NUDIX hydrolase [Ignavibacteriales bacterium]MBL1122479.1 NUDIX hydrolase [Ignavibacteriota bacterium]MBV6421539.1 ADP-ribose pyrophosphatase [Ignavibacteriaceae bacterium]MCE7856578.1 NUDIX hydrolase [Ignavibacteria bacterium CHB3]MEB2296182.1 NUDIX hydrolase [Ignavibacteria bacterium]
MNYRIISSQVIYKGKVFNTLVDQIEYNSGNKAIREVAEHPGGAVVVPVTDNGKIVMVTQYRFPVKEVLLELPAGKLSKGEDPKVCAVRELEEETGYKSDDIKSLGSIYTTPGYSTEKLWIYLAENLKPGNYNREEGEFGMEVFELSLPEVEEKIYNGEIVDGKTICGIYLAKKFF